jgi:hypothetical protein
MSASAQSLDIFRKALAKALDKAGNVSAWRLEPSDDLRLNPCV